MNLEGLRRALARSAEAIISVVLVLLSFGGLLVVLSVSFPEGTSLQQLILDPASADNTVSASDLDLDLHDTDQGRPVATLAMTQREVKGKRSDAIAWSAVRKGTALGDRHSVQTLGRASATIEFDGGRELKMGENSMIVVSGMERRRFSRPRQASFLLLDGQLEGLGTAATGEESEVELTTASGATLIVAPEQRDAEYKVKINPDRSSTVAVYRGELGVRSAGKTVQVRSNQSVTVAQDQAPGLPVALPSRPGIRRPRDDERYVYRAIPPDVEFAWAPTPGAESYRLTISRDSQFQRIVLDRKLTETEFVHGGLRAGRYYWRVAAVAGWAEGRGTATRSVELLRDAQPPALAVRFPAGIVHDSEVLVGGVTEPGAEVFVDGMPLVAGDTGEFEIARRLDPGPNVLVVEAVDAAGNIAYRSKLVHAKF